jgi:hypothetical protein
MELVAILRVMWRRRLGVGLGVLAAIGVALAVPPGPAARHGEAWVRLLLDTPESQVVSATTPDAESLPWRAQQLATLLAAESARLRISRVARVPFGQLSVADPEFDAPTAPAPLPVRASQIAAAASPFTVSVRAQADTPLVSVDARAPGRATATRLVDAVARQLQEATGPVAAGERRRFVVDVLGPTQSRSRIDGHRGLVPVAAALGTLALWCAVVVLLPAPRPRRRA